MKLLTHNMLQSPVPEVVKGYPLLIEVREKRIVESEFKPELLRSLYEKLDWDAFRSGATALGLEDYPEKVTKEMLESDHFLRQLHHGLLEVVLEEGDLICPKSGRKFPVSKGIPNLLLRAPEDQK